MTQASAEDGSGVASEAAPLSVESELYFGIQRERLVRRSRWGGLLLFLSPLVPYEHVDGVPQFIWQLLAELPPAAVVAAFALSLAGIAILIASWRARRTSSLALVVLFSLATALLLGTLGADRAAWDVLPLPDSLVDRPLSMLFGLALSGAGINLAFKPHTRQLGRAALAAAALVLLGFYLWPAAGEAPASTIVRVLLLLPALPGMRFVLGTSLILTVLCFPAFVAALSAVFAITPPTREPRLLSRLLTYGFPALLGFFVFRSLLVHFGDSSVPGTVGSVAIVTALLGTASAALEALGESVVLRGRDPTAVPGLKPLTAAVLCAVVCVALLALEVVLAIPPKKGVTWQLSKPTPGADELFGTLLPAWSRQRARWDRSLEGGGSATEMVELKAKEKAIRDAAKDQPPNVREALLALLKESRDLDLAGRRWFRLVSDVNEANRNAELPYYVDPSLSIFNSRDGLQKRIALKTYRIESASQVRMDGAPFATLRVRRLAGSSGHDRLLGFSRDVQPFALVVSDEIEPAGQDWKSLAERTPPVCVKGVASRANADCGAILARAVSAGRLRDGLTRLTERHELQHQYDGPHLELAPRVLRQMAAYAPTVRARVNRELSAHVAELTTADAPVELGLVSLYQFNHAPPGSLLHHIGRAAIATLQDLDVEELTDAEAEQAFAELFGYDPGALSARAKEAWEDAFDENLPKVE